MTGNHRMDGVSAPDPPRRTLRLEICYDGTSFSGWQAQKAQSKVRTIQGALEEAVFRITGERVTVLGCGRTDAGVSALRQTATFRSVSAIAAEKFTLALNAQLPPEIRVLRTVETASDFHPIADILRKRYRYLLSDSRPCFPFLKDYVWFVRKTLDVERMTEAAHFLLGKHDFAAFETTGSPRTSTERTVFDVLLRETSLPDFWTPPKRDPEWNAPFSTENLSDLTDRPPVASPSSRILMIEVEADGFLYNMVRAIVGTLYLFGARHTGFDSPETMKAILESKDRSVAGPTAPPHGLYMIDVIYPSSRS